MIKSSIIDKKKEGLYEKPDNSVCKFIPVSIPFRSFSVDPCIHVFAFEKVGKVPF
jgi:hypothetical protein